MKLVKLPEKFSKPPHTCIVSGRRDAEVVDFGVDYTGIDPHVYIRRQRVEKAAKELLGMVSAKEVDALRDQLAALEAEAERLAAIVSGTEELAAAEEGLRTALDLAQVGGEAQ